MGKFFVETRSDAPCCYIICEQDGDREILVQTDMDYPGLASSMGWYCPGQDITDTSAKGALEFSQRVPCGGCRCLKEDGEHIYKVINCARQGIDDHLDDCTFDDPGYFSE